MALIFNDSSGTNRSNAGRVVVLDQQDAAGGSIMDVDGWGGFNGFKAIFTRPFMQEMTNHQFAHMLGKSIYLYVFGDRIGQFGLTGLAFQDNCGQGNQKIGIAHVLEYWRRMRLSRREEPVRVTLDPQTVFECYLFAFQGSLVSEASQIFQFNLTMALLPEDDNGPGGNLAISQPFVDSLTGQQLV